MDDTENAKGAERRRGARIRTSFWAQVAGLDPKPILRSGNISISGIFVKIDRSVGPPGSVCLLRLAVEIEGPFVEVMARVIRTISYDDLWSGTVFVGVAFEFLLQTEANRETVRTLVQEFAEIQLKKTREINIDHPFSVQVEGGSAGAREAMISNLGLDRMVLETEWPIQIGEVIHVSVEAPESKRQVRIDGKAIKSSQVSEQKGSRFTTEIEFTERVLDSKPAAAAPGTASAQSLGDTISDAIDGLLAEVINPRQALPAVPPAQCFQGSMGQVSLTSLLGFLENERMSGVLQIKRSGSEISLFVKDGRLVDLDLDGSPAKDIRAVLVSLLDQKSGDFEFACEQVDRTDRVQMTTTNLLLTIFQARDEASKV